MVRAFEPGLKDQLGGHGVEQRPGAPAVAAGFAQACCGVERGQALVGKTNGQVIAALQT